MGLYFIFSLLISNPFQSSLLCGTECGSKSVLQDAVDEVLNAVLYYDLGSPRLFVVTNAGSVTAGAEM
tara:strand:- start:345 stop:548 length:204 start_codon:yes stop_codon:yes gene_type:complete